MPPPSKIEMLPDAVREWLDKTLVDGNFSGYEQVADALKAKGYDISKSGVHRYGKRMEDQMAMVRASTEAAKQLAAAVNDDENHLSGAVLSLVQGQLFETMMELQAARDLGEDDHDERIKTLSRAAKAIAEVSRASVHNKKYQQEVKERAHRAADNADRIAKKGGLSTEAADEIRREILGIAD